MLRRVSCYLGSRASAVSVLARHPGRIADDFAALPAILNQLPVDYRDNQGLQRAVDSAVEAYGSFELAVCWFHSTAPEAPFIVAQAVSSAPCHYVHVLGSLASNPLRRNNDRFKRFELYPLITYHEVILGFVHEGIHSRWLTQSEISDGVIAAIEGDAKRTVVGTVEPWTARPS